VKAFQQDQHYDLRNSEKTEFIAESFAHEWQREKEKSFPLLRTQYATFKHLIWRIQALAMLQTCFEFAGPVLVGKIISYISNPQPEISQGIFLIFAFLVARVGAILISAQTVLNNVKTLRFASILQITLERPSPKDHDWNQITSL